MIYSFSAMNKKTEASIFVWYLRMQIFLYKTVTMRFNRASKIQKSTIEPIKKVQTIFKAK